MNLLQYHLAQCNISKLRDDLDHPSMIEFETFLEPVNQWADRSDGFIWRLKNIDGLASSRLKPVYREPRTIVNLSVWKDIESLSEFTFGTIHTYFLKNRNKWMDKIEQVQFVMWWVKEGHLPTIDEAKSKLAELEQIGPTHRAFNWQQKFNSPSSQPHSMQGKIKV